MSAEIPDGKYRKEMPTIPDSPAGKALESERKAPSESGVFRAVNPTRKGIAELFRKVNKSGTNG